METFRRLTERHQFKLELDPRLHRVKGDRDRLAQALTNLVSNAVKYFARRRRGDDRDA